MVSAISNFNTVTHCLFSAYVFIRFLSVLCFVLFLAGMESLVPGRLVRTCVKWVW